MQNISIVCIGKIKETFYTEACAEYLKRLHSSCKVTLAELGEVRLPDNPSEKEIADGLRREGEAILARIPQGAYMVALCVEGKKMSSLDVAERVLCDFAGQRSSLAFVIGSSHGLSPEVKNRAQLKLSFSDMTFPHQLMRVILLEQIYRGHKILENSNYHK